MEGDDRALSDDCTPLSLSNSSLSFSRLKIFDFHRDLFSDTRSDRELSVISLWSIGFASDNPSD